MKFWKNMKVKDCMEQLKGKNTLMFLGATTSFYLICTPEWLEENEGMLSETIGDYFDACIERLNAKIEKLKGSKESDKSQEDAVNGAKKKPGNNEQIEKIKNQIKNIERLNARMPFSERRVVEIHKRFDGDGYNILTDPKQGDFYSNYWFLAEWKRKHGDGVNIQQFLHDIVPYKLQKIG